MMETTAGTAEQSPFTLQAVGGSGHAKVSYSLEHQLLLLLEQKLWHLSGLQGLANHAGTGLMQLGPTRAEQGCQGADRIGRAPLAAPFSPGLFPLALTLTRAPAAPLSSMPPCCSSPLGRQECAPGPCPVMPFVAWLQRRCCKVTPHRREQTVPCHKCHPVTAARAVLTASLTLWWDLVLPSFSCLIYPSPASQCSTVLPCLPAMLLAWPEPGEGGPQPL